MVICFYQRETSGDMEQSRSLVGGRLLLFFIGQVFKNDHPYQPAHRCSLLACQRPKFIHRFRGEEHIRSLAVSLWPRRHSTHLLCVYYITILSPYQALILGFRSSRSFGARFSVGIYHHLLPMKFIPASQRLIDLSVGPRIQRFECGSAIGSHSFQVIHFTDELNT